jgi:hypothetical protein
VPGLVHNARIGFGQHALHAGQDLLRRIAKEVVDVLVGARSAGEPEQSLAQLREARDERMQVGQQLEQVQAATLLAISQVLSQGTEGRPRSRQQLGVQPSHGRVIEGPSGEVILLRRRHDPPPSACDRAHVVLDGQEAAFAP